MDCILSRPKLEMLASRIGAHPTRETCLGRCPSIYRLDFWAINKLVAWSLVPLVVDRKIPDICKLNIGD